ncbi:uncharacterized protein LOC110738252 [Chenopodium quinoa]|uniref:uncharacterized protein LOC110711367 n=1 Tax=Chenopodium quinoa TaxID=63459 RepID=UPI000B7722DE|nr:uncharacterized protein LOC110711367 [Chenopodium quinoa]XP_021774317.1 uncharacterized protein LOC110738252 [Chenopodium quinoa]
MAGMLPGVEAARRRRVHQSSSINNSNCSSPSSRRLSFSLFSTNTSTFLGHTTRSRTSYEDDDEHEDDPKLGALAREAKVRLDAKLRSTPFKSTRNNNCEERIGRFQNNENEVTRKKKKKNGKFSWNWKSGDQLQDKECAVQDPTPLNFIFVTLSIGLLITN